MIRIVPDSPSMKKPPQPHCASCKHFDCYTDKDCFELGAVHRELYKPENIRTLHRAATAIEGRHYRRANRLEEIILFAKELKIHKLGIAFCIGLKDEAKILEDILKQDFKVISVCCKVCAIPKSEYHLEQIRPEKPVEVMCNPAGQAQVLNEAGTELNIICGLCVGHDAIFTLQSKAPATTFIVKDRVLGHNPAAALYVQYIRRSFLSEGDKDEYPS